MLDTYVDLRQLGRSPGDRDDGDGIRTNRNVCNLRQQRPAIVTLTSFDTARTQPSTAGNVASDPRQLAVEERIATEAAMPNGSQLSRGGTPIHRPTAFAVLQKHETRTVRENLGRWAVWTQRTLGREESRECNERRWWRLRPRRTCSATTDHSSRIVSSSTETGRNRLTYDTVGRWYHADAGEDRHRRYSPATIC